MDKKLPQKRSCPACITDPAEVFQQGVEFFWLGQSGFLFSVGGKLLLVDAYLSNHLVEHNPGLPYDHTRMMAPPLDDAILPRIDYVLITHGHEDHLDPGLMRYLASANAKAQYLIPPGCLPTLQACGVPQGQIRTIEYDTPTPIAPRFTLNAFPAAHPEPVFDPKTTWALSYHLLLEETSLFFAGDTTVYPQMVDWLKAREFDLLILPVNGRDPEKEKQGIVGNMTFEEGIMLSLLLGAPMVGTHFGMFAFNTVDPAALQATTRQFKLEEQILLTEPAVVYTMAQDEESK